MGKQKAQVVDPTTASATVLGKHGQPILDALAKESQRGQVLIAAAFLDNALRGCVLAVCKKQGVDAAVALRLLGDKEGGSRAILADFGAKLPVCRAFGLISQELYEALEAVRKIRNLCAHSDFKITFRHKQVKGHIGVLRGWLRKIEGFAQYAPIGKPPIPAWVRDLNLAGMTVASPPSPRHIFLGATIMIWTVLHNIRWSIRKEEYNGAIQITKGQHGLYD
jgi:DNA-binding MltR family transcriptional regulator